MWRAFGRKNIWEKKCYQLSSTSFLLFILICNEKDLTNSEGITYSRQQLIISCLTLASSLDKLISSQNWLLKAENCKSVS